MKATVFHMFAIVITRSRHSEWIRSAKVCGIRQIATSMATMATGRYVRCSSSAKFAFIRTRYYLFWQKKEKEKKWNFMSKCSGCKMWVRLCFTLSSNKLENSSTWSSSSFNIEKKFLNVSGKVAGNCPWRDSMIRKCERTGREKKKLFFYWIHKF